MARTRLACKRAPTPVESVEGPSGDLGGVPSAATGDSSVRDGDGGPAPTTSKQARGTADIICLDEGAASDSDDEYTTPLDELLASDDSDDPMDYEGSEGEKGSNGKRAGDDEGGDDIVPPTGKKGTRSDVALGRPRLLSHGATS
ncbi:hypothetical protein MRB53_030192 [Persea americana]|uniref:Uncharacterized protein n=1 Tax=Persea americana TaxID=3435 RepID=A0ACC2KKV1_PERAE|nr:hypothetical protein MRB53_030192 [Persea americana]